MNRFVLIALLNIGMALSSTAEAAEPYRTGDIIFQESTSSQSEAIQLATGSRYTHMGMIVVRKGRVTVLEAAGKVGEIPLEAWVARGIGRHYVVKRLKETDKALGPAGTKTLLKAADSFSGKPYDPYFGWEDDRIYCSELVYKLYDRALGVRLAPLQVMREFDLSSPVVKRKMAERYGSRIPLDEKVVPPSAIFDSELLMEVERR